MQDQAGAGPWLLVMWGLGMIPTTIWVWVTDWPASCMAARVDMAECIGEAVMLALLGVFYGLFWPIYWFVYLIGG